MEIFIYQKKICLFDMGRDNSFDDHIEVIDSDFEDSSKKVDKSKLLLRQIDRVAKARTFGENMVFVNGVKILRSMLAKEISEDREIKKLINQIADERRGLVKNVPPVKRFDAASFYEFQEMERVFEMLMTLMRKKGITPEQEISD